MTRLERGWLLLGATVLMATGCGDDDADKAAACPEGVTAGQTTECTCDDGTMSTATCQDDDTLTACDCADGGSGEGGGGAGGRSGAGGSSGAGAGGGGSSGSGGAGTGASGTGGAGPDGGMLPAMDGGTEPEPEPDPVKTDGTLLALCENGTQCGFELDCYGAASGGGFCTTLCTEDEECEEVGPAFSCSSGGLCRQSCMGTDDDSCPEQMSCLMTGGFGGPGGAGTFACAYGPNAGEPPPEAFGECTGDQVCGAGGTCAGDAMGSAGYCTINCTEDTDCEDLEVGSGNLEATCEFSAAGGPPMPVCALNCEGDDAECPDGMACAESMGPLPGLCVYE